MVREATAIVIVASSLLACGEESPSSPGALTAPTILSPQSGEIVETQQPTLTVGNSTGGIGTPTYRFEVARDASFTDVLAADEGIGQGSGNSTSWRVPIVLQGGEADQEGRVTYYWRARASATGEESPWSDSNFRIQEGFFRPAPSGVSNLLVFDPLTNGFSVGAVGGGTFNDRGWMCTAAHTFIRYEVPTLTQGFVEFDVTNLREPNPASDKRMLMIMWDPTRGEYTTNPFRMHLQKMDRRTVDRWHVRLRWISQRQEHNTGFNFFDWDRSRVYHWRVEWGSFPDVETQQVRVFMDGMEVMVRNYDPPYSPATHWIELGAAPRNESLEQAIFSNVRIGTR